MSPDAFLGFAERLQNCTVADVLSIVATVPIDWGFTDKQLLTVAQWLYERREAVVTNLKRHATNT